MIWCGEDHRKIVLIQSGTNNGNFDLDGDAGMSLTVCSVLAACLVLVARPVSDACLVSDACSVSDAFSGSKYFSPSSNPSAEFLDSRGVTDGGLYSLL